MKQKIIGGYVVIWLLFTIYGWLFGANSYKGFFFNLGSSLIWPAKIFPELGAAISAVIIVAMVIAVLIFGRDTRN